GENLLVRLGAHQVDEHRRDAAGRRRSGFQRRVVGIARDADVLAEVDVRVDAAGQHDLAGDVDFLGRGDVRAGGHQTGDGPVVDQDVQVLQSRAVLEDLPAAQSQVVAVHQLLLSGFAA